MKTKYIFLAAAFLMALVGCKEEEVDTFNSVPGINFLTDNGYGVYVDDYENLLTEEDFFTAYFTSACSWRAGSATSRLR